MIHSKDWWKTAVIYHIYPRSYQDSSGDGIGDLNGIRSRLDYLQWLGADAIWLSPIYPSPMADFGYDVKDHCDIDPIFGSMSDMDQLIESAHQKDIRIILDFVPNHTSIEHPWFKESRSSRHNPKRDWYYWKDPADDGGPPNNWLSRFDGNSAWMWDEKSGQYYLHTFLVEQPDLNWRNNEVKQEMLNILRFWYDRGVDGFRVDVSYRVMKDPLFRDNPVNPDWEPGMDKSFRLIEKYTKNTPDIHMFNRWIRETSDEYENRVTIGEMNLKIPQLASHYGTKSLPEFHLPFNFQLIFTDWEAKNVGQLVDKFEETVPEHGWPNWVLSNHDQPRFATRAGSDQARNGLLFLLTARGTPTVYYGDELGMENVDIPQDQVQDPWELLSPGLGLGRDPVRTPMRWDSTKNAGFCHEDVAPWLPIGDSCKKQNVTLQQHKNTSTLAFTKKLIELRRNHSALTMGTCTPLQIREPILAYVREIPSLGEAFIIIINFDNKPEKFNLRTYLESITIDQESFPSNIFRVILNTEMDNSTEFDSKTYKVVLRPDEGIILGNTQSQ